MQQHFSRYIPVTSTERIFIDITHPTGPTAGVVFVLHGLAGWRDESFLTAARDVFIRHGLTTVAIDARYGLGQGDGPLEKACFSTFIADLGAAVSWAETQPFFRAPFYLCGHSLGGGACLHHALNHPNRVAGVVTLSAVFNGNLLIDSYRTHKPDFMKQWETTRFLPRTRPDIPDKSGRIAFDHLADAVTYQLDKDAARLTAPLLMICGDRDISSTKEMNLRFFDGAGGKKEMACLPGANHSYTNAGNIPALKTVVDNWLSQLEMS